MLSSYLFFTKLHQVGAFFSPFLEAGKGKELTLPRYKRQGISYFSYQVWQTTSQKQLKEGKFIWLTVLGHKSVMAGKAW